MVTTSPETPLSHLNLKCVQLQRYFMFLQKTKKQT